MDPRGNGEVRRGGTGGPPGEEDPQRVAARVIRDLRLLARRAAVEAGLSPGERLPEAPIRLSLSIPLDPVETTVGVEATSLVQDVARAVQGTVREFLAFRPGRVHCLQCGTSDCPHGAPGSDTMVLSGYGPSGKPRFLEFAHLLLDRGDPRAGSLFGDRPRVVVLRLDAQDLHRDLLSPPPPDVPVRILGQVCAGPLDRDDLPEGEGRDRFVLSLQVVETRSSEGRTRLRLNVLGADVEVLSSWGKAIGRDSEERVRRLVRGMQGRLDDLGRRAARERRRGGAMDVEGAVSALLERVRAEMEQAWGGDAARTRHARRRHLDGDRPTALALADAREASEDRLRWDQDRETVVVLGPGGRTHVFTVDGRHVTSIVRSPGEDRRKETRQRWRLLTAAEMARFRQAVSPERREGSG